MSITRLTVYIKNIIRIKTEDIENYTAEDHNTKNTVEIIIETKLEKDIISATRKILVHKT
jgi:hypothetical protein